MLIIKKQQLEQINDTWSIKDESIPTKGGTIQFFTP